MSKIKTPYNASCGHLEHSYQKEGSFEKLAEKLGVNVSYVYDYLVKGIIPSNPEIRHKMGIYTAKEKYRRRRRERLDQIARDAGYTGWSNYETKILKGDKQCLKEL